MYNINDEVVCFHVFDTLKKEFNFYKIEQWMPIYADLLQLFLANPKGLYEDHIFKIKKIFKEYVILENTSANEILVNKDFLYSLDFVIKYIDDNIKNNALKYELLILKAREISTLLHDMENIIENIDVDTESKKDIIFGSMYEISAFMRIYSSYMK